VTVDMLKRRPGAWRATAGKRLLHGALALWLLFLGLPIVSIIWRVLPVGATGWAAGSTLDALRLSLVTSTIAMTIVALIGTPVAYVLARESFRGKAAANALVDLPVVMPPAVAGLALLMTFGRRGLLGPALSGLGIELPFTTAAVIVAQVFVAGPFYVRAAVGGLGSVDRRLEQMSALLGVSNLRTFFRITLPLAAPQLIAGLLMTWARALGEFGATIMFAGSLQGRTQTMPLAIYMGLESNLDSALALSVVLVAVSFGVLVLVRLISQTASAQH
jgi:molybdate transport system permease protein